MLLLRDAAWKLDCMVAIWAYRLCRVSTMAILRYMGLRTCRPWLVLQTRKIAYVYLWMWTFAFVNSRSSEVATMHAVLKLREIARRSPWEFSYVNWNVLVLIIAVILLVGVSYRMCTKSIWFLHNSGRVARFDGSTCAHKLTRTPVGLRCRRLALPLLSRKLAQPV